MPPLDPPKHYDTEDREYDTKQESPPPLVPATAADDNELSQPTTEEDTSTSSTSDNSNEEPTKEELYEEAQELDVEGRSSMNKDELQEAVEEEKDSKPAKKSTSKKK